MKKEYLKPRAVIQNLTVNCFVAGACQEAGATVVDFTEDTCTVIDPDSGYVFFSDNCADGTEWGVNVVNPNPKSPFAQLCYHRPSDALSFFNS